MCDKDDFFFTFYGHGAELCFIYSFGNPKN